jgi:DNA-binding transcriptional regulator WhiA
LFPKAQGHTGYKTYTAGTVTNHLTFLGLAHWILCDGSVTKGGGVTLHTSGFSLAEVEQMKEELRQKWNLKVTIHKKLKKDKKNYYYTIYIAKASYEYLMQQQVIYNTIKRVPSLRHKRRPSKGFGFKSSSGCLAARTNQ